MPAELVAGLFDDAALFPPGDAPMPVAVPAHTALLAQLPDVVGPFVVPASRVGELIAHLDGDAFPLSLIADATTLAAAVRDLQAAGVPVAAVEVPPPADGPATAQVCQVLAEVLPADVPTFVELPRGPARDAVLDEVAAAGRSAKLRTGGLRPDLFPSAAELAGTLAAVVGRGVAFKCTAGLHAALPHVDRATGFAHHGFLTILLAADVLADGGTAKDAAAALQQTTATDLRHWTPERVTRARRSFRSFGTCSVLEPVEDLRSLDLWPLPDRIPS